MSLAPASSVLAATTWTALVGTDTPDHAIQGSAFFPCDLSIQVGDVVTWNANSGEIHSVSFGTPPPPGGFADAPIRITNVPGGGVDATFNGTGWVNSGLLSTVPAPGESANYTLKFSAAGDYQFHCLVHSTMQGTLHVLPAGQPVPHDQAFYNPQIIPQQNQLLAKALQVMASGLSSALSSATPSVTAGDGQLFSTASVAVLRFQPNSKGVHVGDTVTWTNLDPETPHTVTFGGDPRGGPFGALLPGTNVPGVVINQGQTTVSAPITSTSEYINSGFAAAPGPFGINGKTFKVTFTAPGVYQYHCVLHDDLGMVGAITVLPAP